ncbi:sushi, von Willebrand factor type A, EGF and pentraxin domain-containing protein 1-like [Mustelus asterias]
MSERLILALLAIWVARVTGVCDQPPRLENGFLSDEFISLHNFSVGIKVAYKCYPGYKFQEGGSRRITCRENSTWSPLRAVCEPRNCGNPGELSNGYYNASGTTFGMKAIFYCDKGYSVVGRSYRTCTAAGWDGQVPTCEIVTCPDPPHVANGTVSPPPGEFWTFGSVAKYSCIAGHSLIGEDTITCTATQEWKEHPPRCQVVRCVRPELPKNAHMVSRFQPVYNYQDTITYKCDTKFKMVGKSIIECKENNTFVPSPPTCEPLVIGQCGKPPALKNGSPTEKSISRTTFPVGSPVIYKCHPGYVLQEGGSIYITCRTNVTWSPLRAVCEPRNCGNPGEILNGYYIAPDTTFGSQVTFYCDEGYNMVGKATRTCTAHGWDGQVPTCEIVTCPDPPPIANGAVSSPPGEFWTFGNVAKYSCLAGYFLIGEDTIACTATGDWNGNPPKCQVAKGDCGKPPALENGSPTDEHISQTVFPVGSRVTYKCYPGYMFQEGGSRYIICRTNAMWSPLRAVCEPRNCGNPGEILNGYYIAPDTTFGSQVTFYCDEGYNMVGKATRTCTAHGWDGQVPTCEIVTCPDPPPIANGTVSSPPGDFWTFGSVAKYSCLAGYFLIGEDTITCTATGDWNGNPPKCQVAKGDCGKPPALENGSPTDEHISQTIFPVGSRVAYKCYPGYVFQAGGSRYIICRTNSTWSPLRAVCEPRNCGNPGEILNGYYLAPGTTFGSQVTFYCNEGYNMVGKANRTCTAHGWDGQVPTCEIVTCPDPPPIANGTVSSPPGEFWTFESVANYSCLAGYFLIGEDTITCTATGDWSGNPPKCQVAKGDCGKPPALENGSPTDEHISQTIFPVGSRVAYKCYLGYVFQAGGSRYIICRTNSTWSPLRAVCEPRNCGNPGEILNGYYIAPDTTLGSRVTFYCDEGYNMVGKANRTCTAHGWDGQVPTCEIVICPDPPPIANGTVSSPPGEFWTFESVAKYSCLAGYFLIGEDTITCTATGDWNGNPPKCQARNCGNPGKIQNGYYLVTGTTLGSRVTFYCDEGYSMVGKATRTCTPHGWDGQVPTCEIVTCPDPPPIANGRVSSPPGEFWTFGSVAKYSCHVGYFLIGEDTINCTATGDWNENPPKCQARNCGIPGEIQNGYYVASVTTFGSQVTYYCNKGYNVVGKATRTCTAHGWDGQVPTCEFVTCPDPPPIANGRVSSPPGEFWTFGSAAKYSCLAGYFLIGEDTIACTATGDWSGNPPKCQAAKGDRGKPPALKNGSPTDECISQPTFPVGTKVTYKCNQDDMF